MFRFKFDSFVNDVTITLKHFGRDCGAIGRAVTSDIRDPWFESQHRRSLFYLIVHICQLQFRKTKQSLRGPDLPV